MGVVLCMNGRQHELLRNHLFPGDGNEAVALLLCGRGRGGRHKLVVREVHPIPHEKCSSRTPQSVSWSTEDTLPPLLEKAASRRWALVKVHSHPTNYERFSETDDDSDSRLFSSVHGWVDSDEPHASAVMLPGGRMFGRVVGEDGAFSPLERISVAGSDLHFWSDGGTEAVPEFARRHAQLFGSGTTAALSRLSVAVVGCSGTGSPVVEQLARLGVARLLLVDPDVVEEKNLNRIVGSTRDDADAKRPKVQVLERSVRAMGLGTEVLPRQTNLFDRKVIREVADCDVVFGCMDSVDGRHLLGRLAVFYQLPYFDIGVKLVADGSGGIDQVCGTVHYLEPGGSSLLSRGVYTLEQVRAAAMRRESPEEYARQAKAGYIEGVREDRPAVVSVNMLLASWAVNELLARIHPFRDNPNDGYARHGLSLTQGVIYSDDGGAPCAVLARHAGRGDVEPLLDMPEFGGT